MEISATHNPEICSCEPVHITWVTPFYDVFLARNAGTVERHGDFGTCVACRQVLSSDLTGPAAEAYLAAVEAV